MATVAVVHQKITFRERRGDVQLYPSPNPQLIPDTVTSHPYFMACLVSEWITDVVIHGEELKPESKKKGR